MSVTAPLARALALALAVLGMACSAGPGGRAAPPVGWRTLESGLELGSFALPLADGETDGRAYALRIDPERFELKLFNASATDEGTMMTARSWADRHGLVAAVNASMYQEDLRTSVSLMRSRDHVNNPRLTRDRAVLAFDPLDGDTPPVKLIDLDCEPFDEYRDRYGAFVQSIRMLSCKGENVWSPQPRRASLAAVGTDGASRVVFVLVRTPLSTHDAINALVALPLGLERLMYVEGGPEAQLYARGDGEEHEIVGSFGPGFTDSEDNRRAWPVPNVIGVARKGTFP